MSKSRGSHAATRSSPVVPLPSSSLETYGHRCVVLRAVRDAAVVVRGVHGDRARVDAEDLGDAGDELLEERVQLERRERGVRDRLQLSDSPAASDRQRLDRELRSSASSHAALWP